MCALPFGFFPSFSALTLTTCFLVCSQSTDLVWQVCWQEEDIAKNLNFFSISSDGRVTMWTLSKNELQWQDVTELKLVTALPPVAAAAAAVPASAVAAAGAAAAETAGLAGTAPVGDEDGGLLGTFVCFVLFLCCYR